MAVRVRFPSEAHQSLSENILRGIFVCLQRNAEGVLDFADDEDTVEGAEAVQFTKGADDQILIMRHAAGIYLQHIVIVP